MAAERCTCLCCGALWRKPCHLHTQRACSLKSPSVSVLESRLRRVRNSMAGPRMRTEVRVYLFCLYSFDSARYEPMWKTT
jgi:hypothetical protein